MTRQLRHAESGRAGGARRAAYAPVATAVLAGTSVSAGLIAPVWVFIGDKASQDPTLALPALAAAFAFLVLPLRIALPGYGDRVAAIALLLLATPTAMFASLLVGIAMSVSDEWLYVECVDPPCDDLNEFGWSAVMVILAFGPIATWVLALRARQGRPLWQTRGH